MAVVEVVVTDLDGTLWWGDEPIHPATRRAWSDLEAAGIPVLVATGRRISSARAALSRAGLCPPAVLLNGALVLDLARGDVLYRECFAPDDASTVLEAFRACGLEPCVYVEHPQVEVFVGADPSTCPPHLESLGASAEAGVLEELVAELPVLQFGILGCDRRGLGDVAARLAGVAETHLGPDGLYGDHSLTVGPKGLSKWIGIAAYCRQHGLRSDRVLAIGDGPNDRELLSAAAVAVAPEDAHPDALAVADHIVPSARVGGWAEILELVPR